MGAPASLWGLWPLIPYLKVTGVGKRLQRTNDHSLRKFTNSERTRTNCE
jgi:hypothetical protein